MATPQERSGEHLVVRSTILSRRGANEVIELRLHDGRNFETSLEAIRVKVETPALASAAVTDLNLIALRRAASHLLAAMAQFADDEPIGAAI